MNRKRTPEAEAWLRESYATTPNEELLAELAGAFGVKTTKSGLQAKASDMGLRKPRKVWTPEESRWFVEYVPGHTEGEISAEHERLFGNPLTESQIANAKTRFGVKSGTHGGRFRKGQEPPNKGKTWAEFMPPESQERCRATQFKKGEVHDRPDGWLKPVGHERVDSKDGYTWVKVRDSRTDGIQRNRPGHFNENYRLKHHVVWEQANGQPVPPHTMVVFADHDKENFDPANLVAVPRRLWSVISRMNMDYCDRETLEACMARAELHAAISGKRKEVCA